MSIKVAINGFGRIGRCFARAAEGDSDIEIVAVNDLGNLENLAYLLKYDTVYRKAQFEVSANDGVLTIGKNKAKFLQEKDPTKLPWGDLGVDVVVESTGLYTDFAKAKVHVDAGAKRVVISAPAKSSDESVSGVTVLMGVNED